MMVRGPGSRVDVYLASELYGQHSILSELSGLVSIPFFHAINLEVNPPYARGS